MNENIQAELQINKLLEKLQEATEIARKAHQGQFDKGGHPNYSHAEAVSQAVYAMMSEWQEDEDYKIEAMITAYLHDVVEDSSLKIGDLWKHHIPSDCILAIERLTKRVGQDYWEYLINIKRCKLAAAVKIADMTHNSDLSRLSSFTDKDIARREKYQDAIKYLSHFTCEKRGLSAPISEMAEKATRIGEIICKPCLNKFEIEYDLGEEYINSLPV